MVPGVNGFLFWFALVAVGCFCVFSVFCVGSGSGVWGRASLLLMHACALFMHYAVINYTS